jgi:hypothetical protein
LTLAKFLDDPWRTSHASYQHSALAMTPAPEYASSEVILASLYRVIGFPGLMESAVPQEGRDLDREIQKFLKRRQPRAGATLDADSFHMMLHSALESPKLPNQSSKRFLQVTPLVPQAAVFSGSARTTGNPWSAGTLVRRMVWLGARDVTHAQRVWSSLFGALSIGDDDDIFARFLQAEIKAWAGDRQWTAPESPEAPMLAPEDRAALVFPAQQFVRDLEAVIEAKDSLTRRQWTSLLEAALRIAAVSHVLWLCEVHARTWACIRESLAGGGPATIGEARAALFPAGSTFLSYGDRALASIKDRASSYLLARLGLNAVLWALEEEGVSNTATLGTAAGLLAVCTSVRDARDKLAASSILQKLSEIQERENRAILCRKGIGSNIMEFARHVLGQRQAASAVLRGYDQGYALKKKGASASSPWVVGLGPVAVLTLVHCSLANTSGPRSVRRLAQHLAAYGIAVDHRDVAQNDLGHQLRMLGLVLDSPDAESGMLLVPPFPDRAA